MLTHEKRTLTDLIKSNLEFKNVINKLTIDADLDDSEKMYVLTSALIFLTEYSKDRRFKSYAEIAYYLILKYSIKYSDYKPLYDFSTLFGFYPISKTILDNNLLSNSNVNDFFTTIQLQEFKKTEKESSYIETYEQFKERNNFLEDKSNEKGFLAPTSYGKSSVIIDYIKSLNESKIVIVVPTKSLLMQTYRLIRDNALGYKILIHEEMYGDEEKFIAVFTQERALRLLKRKKNIFFDVIIIDEAHNILKKVKSGDNRSLLLTRLLRINKNLNQNQKVIYLSPLINKINNLNIEKNQNITSHTINFNIKVPEIYEYKIENIVFKHNRYFINKNNTGLPIVAFLYDNFMDYIKYNSGLKNFLYYNSPKIIEQLALELSDNLYEIDEDIHILETIKNLKEEVHANFYGVDLLKHGIIYLHGKLPDLVKEYLESKFKELPQLKYIVANSVILEGINLPIDSLFILNTYGLHGKELTNLIGRVNRLNEIFKPGGSLNKLLPKVHFINNEFKGKSNINMFSKILELRNRVFDDKVENPTLENHDIEKEKDVIKEKIIKLVEDEEFLIAHHTDDLQKLKQYVIENGINLFYSDTDKLIQKLNIKLGSAEIIGSSWNEFNLLDKIFKVFIEDFINDDKFIVDFEFYRLHQKIARDYYEKYINNRQLRFFHL